MLVRRLSAAAAAVMLACAPIGVGHAETCTKDTLRRVVDEAGARLRVLTAETQPRIMTTLRRLKEKRGWTGTEADEKASALIADERTAELDAKAAALLARIDELAETSGTGEADCSRLAELEAASAELQATVRAKSQHILGRLEAEAGGPQTAEASPPPAPTQSAAPAQPPSAPVRPVAPEAKEVPPATEKEPPPPAKAPLAAAREALSAAKEPPITVAKEALPPAREPPAPPREAPSPQREANAQSVTRQPLPPPPVAKSKPAPGVGWSTETRDQLPPRPDTLAQAPGQPMPPIPQEQAGAFSREEIAEASRGFFGTISSGLGNVIEHAFSTLGRPTGYVLGSEGGGAFIAGLRYGKGTLFLSDGSRREVHWHGPSIGYDIGAAGSKTMFLVYNLQRDIDIFGGYSGVDGSAYLVGGVGMTILTDGKVVMAPIRSGLGVRLGANIGYIRFTPRSTWNPF
jgi:hypothetical protein